MKNLSTKLILVYIALLLSACQSMQGFSLKTFPKSKSRSDDMHIVYVKSDRVRQQCAFLNAEAENNWRHQYFLYILRDKGEVLQIIQPTHQDKTTCNNQMARIEKLRQSAQDLKLCLRGKLEHEVSGWNVDFGVLGQYKIAYEALFLDSVCNSKKCFSNSEVWVDTCPGFEKH